MLLRKKEISIARKDGTSMCNITKELELLDDRNFISFATSFGICIKAIGYTINKLFISI